MKKFFHWWTLENAGKSVNLLVKLFIFLGILVVANFYVLKPHIVWQESYFILIDENSFQESFGRDETIPQVISDYIKQFNSPSSLSTLFQLIEIESRESITLSGTELLFRASNNSFFTNNPPLDSEVETISNQFKIFISNDEITEGEYLSSIEALKNSLSLILTVTITNIGPGEARGLHVIAPEGFEAWNTPSELSFLRSGDIGRVTMITNSPSEPNEMISRGLKLASVTRSPTRIINANIIISMGVVLIILWTIVILREIYFPSEK